MSNITKSHGILGRDGEPNPGLQVYEVRYVNNATYFFLRNNSHSYKDIYMHLGHILYAVEIISHKVSCIININVSTFAWYSAYL
jgi:hypothetical protein